MRPVAIRQAMPEASARAIASAVRGDGWNVSSSTVPSRSIATARTARASSPGGSCSTSGAAGTERSTCRRPTPRRRRRSRRPGRSAASRGIAPPPFSICFATVSAESGARLSRSGPTLPLVPASLSVWQPPQVATNADLPAATSAPEPPPVVVALVCAVSSPSSRRSTRRRRRGVARLVAAGARLAARRIHRLRGRALTDRDLARDRRTRRPSTRSSRSRRRRRWRGRGAAGSSRRARMRNSLPSRAAESVGDRFADPADRG